MTYAKSGLFWSQCFLPSLVIRKAQAGAGKSSLGLLWCKQFVPVQKLDSTPVYTSILGEIFDITSIIHASADENRTRLETGLFCQPSTTYSTKAIFFLARATQRVTNFHVQLALRASGQKSKVTPLRVTQRKPTTFGRALTDSFHISVSSAT